jgi:type I restriction enzyme S subunit
MNNTRSSAIYSAIPSDWKIVPLGKLLRRVKKPIDVEARKLYCEIGIFSHGKGVFHKEERTGTSLGNKSVFWVEPDCFVVNIVFAWEQAIAKTTDSEKGMIASHRFPMYKPEAGVLDLDFLVSFFNTPQGKYLLGLASPGGAGRNKTLGQQAFLDLSIPLPSFPEQCKITDILNTVDQAIALTERRIEAARQRKKGLMQRLLTGRVRFPEFVITDGYSSALRGLVPKDWRILEFGDFASKSSKKFDPKKETGIHECIELEHISQETGQILGTTSTEEQKSVKNSFSAGQVLFGKLRPYLKKFTQPDFSGVCSSEIWVLSGKKDLCSNDFLFYLVQSERFLAAANVTSGTKMPRSDWGYVSEFAFAIPLLQEQCRIAAVLQACDREIELLTQKRDALQRQKKGLMQRLLTGRVRVKV